MEQFIPGEDRTQSTLLPELLDEHNAESDVAQLKTEPLHDKITALKGQMKALKEIEVQLNEAGNVRKARPGEAWKSWRSSK